MYGIFKGVTMSDVRELGGVEGPEARTPDEKRIKEVVSEMRTEAENFILAFRIKYRRKV